MTIQARNPADHARLVQIGLVVAFAAVLATILTARIPPLLDYPNHLARFWLLSGGDRVAPISAMYRIDWSRASTNIGIDLVVVALGKVLPYQTVGKLIAIVAVAGAPAGAVVLNRIALGRWHWWQLSLPMLAWTTTALFGFLSYQVALAIALAFACLEPTAAGRPVEGALARLACGAIVLLFHPFGLLFYGVLIAALAIGPGWQDLFVRSRLSRAARGLALALAVVAIPALFLYALTPTPPGAHVAGRALFGWARPTPYNAIWRPLHPSPATACRSMPFSCSRCWRSAPGRRRSGNSTPPRGPVHRRRPDQATLALVMPASVGDAGGYVDRRLPLMAALMLFASLQPGPVRSRFGVSVLAAVLLILDLGKSAWIASIWSARERDVRSIEQALGATPAGAAVLAVQIMPASLKTAPVGRYLAGIPGNNSESTLRHVPALVVPERHAFIPTLFTVPGQQPLRVLPPWSEIAVTSSRVPDAHVLDGPLTTDALKADPYLADWRRRFDYVLVIGGDLEDEGGPFVPPPQLQLVAGDGYARLFRIVR